MDAGLPLTLALPTAGTLAATAGMGQREPAATAAGDPEAPSFARELQRLRGDGEGTSADDPAPMRRAPTAPPRNPTTPTPAATRQAPASTRAAARQQGDAEDGESDPQADDPSAPMPGAAEPGMDPAALVQRPRLPEPAEPAASALPGLATTVVDPKDAGTGPLTTPPPDLAMPASGSADAALAVAPPPVPVPVPIPPPATAAALAPDRGKPVGSGVGGPSTAAPGTPSGERMLTPVDPGRVPARAIAGPAPAASADTDSEATLTRPGLSALGERQGAVQVSNDARARDADTGSGGGAGGSSRGAFAEELTRLLAPSTASDPIATPTTTPGLHELPAVLPMAAPEVAPRPVAPPPVELQLAPAVTAPEFVPRLSGEIAVLARDGVHEARVHVHPVELGPIAVRISVDGSAAQVHLAADNALTRTVLESAMPSLAGALRENGLTLTGGGVFEQAHQGERQRNADDGVVWAGHTRRDTTTAADDGMALTAPLRRLRATGALDLYA